MKKITITLLFSTLFLGVGMLNAQQVAHVNSNDILDAIPEYTAAQTKLDNEQKRHKAEIERQQKEIADIYKKADDIVKAVQDKSDAEKQAAMAKLEPMDKQVKEKQQTLQEYQKKAAEDMGKMENDLMSPIYKKVQTAIEAVGKTKNVGYIFDLAVSAGSGAMLYYGGGTDLTEAVKKQLGL